MRLKYKKTILLIILVTLGIGLIVITLTAEKAKQNNVASTSSTPDKITVIPDEIKTTVTPTLKPLETEPTDALASPTPTSLPIYPLKVDGYPRINALIKDYYDSKLNCDLEFLKTLLSDPSKVPTVDQLQQDTMYVEDYQALKCYIKKSFEEGAYIVYVYQEIKFLNIDTPAPAVKRFYVVTDKDDNLKIFSGKFDEETKAYYIARNEDADVKELIQETNAKGEKAKEKDELLKTFWEGLDATQEN